jgi:hypothetical protein
MPTAGDTCEIADYAFDSRSGDLAQMDADHLPMCVPWAESAG